MTSRLRTSIDLAADERIRLTRLAALSHGRTARGGRLFLTTHRLVFRPGLHSRMFGAVEISVPRSAIDDVRVEAQRSGFFAGGFRHRIVIRRKDGTDYRFAVSRPQGFATVIRADLSLGV